MEIGTDKHYAPLLKTANLKGAVDYYDEAGCDIMVGKPEELYKESINIEQGLENFANDGNRLNYLFAICHRGRNLLWSRWQMNRCMEIQ